MKAYISILAGGSGQRLWPLSTPENPKQLIPFIDNQSLLDITVQRLSAINHEKELCVVTSSSLAQSIKKQSYDEISWYVEEPVGRNTAPAILLTCLKSYEKDPHSLIAFFPADHFIPDQQKFCTLVEKALTHCAKNDTIATLGLVPTGPATGYGYIQADTQEALGKNYFPAVTFHEKPDLARAKRYAQQNNMFWNAGMFLAKTSVLLQEFKQHAPFLWDTMQQFLSGTCTYGDLEKISVDYAIMEKSQRITVFPADFEWHDVGNISVFLELQKCYQKSKQALIEVDAQGNLVSSRKKTIACVGVQNLCIVETDNELLIVAKDKAEQVKAVVQAQEDLKEKKVLSNGNTRTDGTI